MWPIGMPGIDKQFWKAVDKGIHFCSFILIDVLERFLDLIKLSRLNDPFIAPDKFALSEPEGDDLPFAIITYLFSN